MEKRGSIIQDYLGWIVLAVLALILGVVMIFVFSDSGKETIENLLKTLRFGK